MTMRLMGLDVGTRTIGVAVSDVMGMIANGVETIHRTSPTKDFERLEILIKQYGADTLIVGYPKNMNGSIGERAKACEQFAKELEQRFQGVKVILWDERLSTVAAQRVLIEADMSRNKRKKVVDTVAATIILQNYLDSVKKY